MGHVIAQSYDSPRIKYNFNPGWKMMVGDDPNASAIQYDDKNWKAVTLPHAFNEDDAFKKAIADLTTGIVWYRKHFTIPVENKGQKVFLEFEGIRHGGEFFLNGKSIGLSENGVMAFGFDISDEVKFGEDNVLAARISNAWDYKEKATGSAFEWNDKNFYANYGGINKNVYLHITSKLHQTLALYSNLKTTGVYVYAKDFDITKGSAFITAETQVKNEYATTMDVDYSVIIEDAVTGKKISTLNGGSQKIGAGETKIISAGAKTSGLNFWSWGYGYLYNVYTILQSGGKTIDMVKTTTGFRKTSFENGMLHLNDRIMQVKGYGQRTTNEWPAIGLSVPAWLSDYSNHLMVTGNASLVRWMHVTPWKQDVESCDRVGLMEAMPAGDAEKDVDGRRWEQRTEVMRDAIIYNRNNPSIIFYECGNKGISEEHMLAMKKIRDEYDPHGGRAIGCREMLESKTAEYGGEMLYINKSAGKPLWSMEYSRDEGLRKYWDEYSPPYHKEGDGPLYRGADASEYNHNQDAHAIEDVVRWYEYWHERPGTGKRVNDGGVNIIFSESNTHFRGAENYRRSGEVDALRIPKDGFYANQIMWDGWVDIEKPRIHIIGHWNYKEGVTKNVYVVSSADKVELFLNGKSLGWGEQSNQFLYTFKNIAWHPGTISAIGYGKTGKKICEASHETAGEPANIRLTGIKSPGGFIADGADLALIEIEVTDAKGNRCPTALNTIHFELMGPAEWRGGMAQGPDNYILSKTLPVECGVNRILIRSTTQAGTILLKATSDGLKSANLLIIAKPFIQKDGLSLQMPADSLKPYLQRGPTPAGPSYRPSRAALKIINATAGTNTDKTASSYDDNEATDWVNDGELSTAWIEYELGKAAPISQVALKLNNFRTRSYPLRISVDGKEVFRDSTTRNLGYFTAIFKPTTGKKIKIELYKAGNKKEDTSTEVNGKKLDDGVARDDTNAKGRFSIIEAEVYEVLKDE
jgi:beta-galactosidase